MLKNFGFLVGMISIALLVFFGLVPIQDQILDSWVTTGPEITFDAWRDSFRLWAAVGISTALIAAILWFVFGQWVFSLNDNNATSNKRTIWFSLMVLAAVAAAPGVIFTPPVQEWGMAAWLFYLINNLLVFYISTLLLSPSSFKYIPWGAKVLRWW